MVAFTKEKYILKANAFPINTIAIMQLKGGYYVLILNFFFHYLFITILFITCLKVFIIIDFFYVLTYISCVTVSSDLSMSNYVRFNKAVLQNYTMAVFLLELIL